MAWGPKFPKFTGRPGQSKTIGKMGDLQPRFSSNLSTEKSGNNKNFPKFPNLIWRTPPGHQTFGDLPRVPLGPKFPKSIGRRRPPKPPRPKVTIGKLGGFSAQIFPRALPKEFWQQRQCWLENPQSSLWWGEL